MIKIIWQHCGTLTIIRLNLTGWPTRCVLVSTILAISQQITTTSTTTFNISYVYREQDHSYPQKLWGKYQLIQCSKRIIEIWQQQQQNIIKHFIFHQTFLFCVFTFRQNNLYFCAVHNMREQQTNIYTYHI